MIKNTNNQKGYVILFTILIVSLILLMSLGIANVSSREVNLSRSARESHYALFAADTGGECILYHYNQDPNPFMANPTGPITLNCAGKTITSTTISFFSTSGGSGVDYTFPPLELPNGCAIMTAHINEDGPNDLITSDRRNILRSKGYNVSCAEVVAVPASPKKVERFLEYTYDYSGTFSFSGGGGGSPVILPGGVLGGGLISGTSGQ